MTTRELKKLDTRIAKYCLSVRRLTTDIEKRIGKPVMIRSHRDDVGMSRRALEGRRG